MNAAVASFGPPLPEHVRQCGHRLDKLLAASATWSDQREAATAIVLVTPLGLADPSHLRGFLAPRGGIRSVQTIPQFSRAATLLYAPADRPADAETAAVYELAWDTLFPDGAGEMWEVSLEAHEELGRQKTDVRRAMRSVRLRLVFSHSTRLACLHAFHVPDRDRLELEMRRLRWIAGQ